MRPKYTLRIRLEVEEIAPKRVQDKIDIVFGERGVEHQRGVQGYAGRDAKQSLKEGLEGVVATDVVWDGVGKPDVLEAAGRDLEVVIWIAPGSKTVVRGVRKDRCVIKVRGI